MSSGTNKKNSTIRRPSPCGMMFLEREKEKEKERKQDEREGRK